MLERAPSSADGSATLAHVRAMGFTHLLVASDASQAGPASHAPDEPEVAAADFSSLRAIARLCADAGLKLLLDVDIARLTARSALRVQHPEWFRAITAPEDLPDPRRAPREVGLRWRLEDPRTADAALAWWTRHLQQCVTAGAAGFRLVSVDAAPPAWWTSLCEQVHVHDPATGMMAWTQGLKPPTLAALADAGFDYTFCSAEWWDFRATWLAAECRRLGEVAPPLACAGPPAVGSGREPKSLLARRRAMWLAATLGAGWLMPAGFEDIGDAPRGASPEVDLAPGSSSSPELLTEISAVNASLDADSTTSGAVPVLQVAVGWVGVLRAAAGRARLLLLNADLDRLVVARLAAVDGGRTCAFVPWCDDAGREVGSEFPLQPGQSLNLHGTRVAPPRRQADAPTLQARLALATQGPRIAIEAVTPCVDAGRFPVKRVLGDGVRVEADVFMDGHDVLAVALCWRARGDEAWQEQPMQPLGNDRYRGAFEPARIGRFEYTVRAWRDAYASYRHELTVKHDAVVPIALELEEGRQLLAATAATAASGEAASLRALLAELDAIEDDEGRYQRLVAEQTAALMTLAQARAFLVEHPVLGLEVDRRAAQFASWYELFPRSQTDDPARHGGFLDVIPRLPAIREMGFDVLYFPPIHPIGDAFRKGRNNTLDPAPDDPGSPYAIGSAQGGHTAIHPQLGTLEDFRALRDAARDHGLELALDFAIQCSPDHPWLVEHPEWFDWRPDGSLRYAENPPKKYQDIVNVDFYAEGAVPSLWQALCDVVLYWAGEGVRSFRVDNPHTKPYPFWEWLIARVRDEYPDALFLAEAFTRPKPMYRLAKAGFNQSYTYFTWRHTKQEFTEYLTELSQGPAREFFRPNFFVNTPDINPTFLQRSGRTGFLIRAALATTLSGLWGMYSGFELCEAAALPGREEYLDSEKYQIKPRDWAMPGNIVAEISQLNAIRRAQPALQSHLGVRFLQADDPQVLFFERFAQHAAGAARPLDRVLVAILLDPFAERHADLHLPLADWGLAEDAALRAEDLLHEVTATWHGAHQHVWLGRGMPFAIWHLQET